MPPQNGCPAGAAGGSELPLVGSTKVELVRAHLGTASLSGIGGSPVKMGLKRAVLHPQYNAGILDFDAAVLELARPLVFGKYVQPICLPLATQKFPAGRKCVISGWGNTQEGNGESSAGPPPPAADRAPRTPPGLPAPAHGPTGLRFVVLPARGHTPSLTAGPDWPRGRKDSLCGPFQKKLGGPRAVRCRAPRS